MDLQGSGREGMDWIELAQDWERWLGISGLFDNRLASQKGFYTMEYISN
jgi:hypothetical protein